MNPVLQQAGELHRQRLLPAKLKTDGVEGKRNALYFNNWALSKGLNLAAMTAQAICDEFYDAVVADVKAEHQLLWEVPPKALVKRLTQDKAPAQHQDLGAEATNDRASRKKASEEADKQIRLQEEAKKRVIGLVENFSLSHKNGRTAYSFRVKSEGVITVVTVEEKQKQWRKQIADSKDYVALESVIKGEQAEIRDSQRLQ